MPSSAGCRMFFEELVERKHAPLRLNGVRMRVLFAMGKHFGHSVVGGFELNRHASVVGAKDIEAQLFAHSIFPVDRPRWRADFQPEPSANASAGSEICPECDQD
jgi:hypothetical protein